MLWLFPAKFTGTNPDMLSTLQTWVTVPHCDY